VWQQDRHEKEITQMTCVELNPDYLAIGQKILPEARWVCASVFSDLSAYGRFDCAISNPPFGAIRRDGLPLRYKGPAFDLSVVEVASTLADYGAFILPQMSCPFGTDSTAHGAFHKTTGLSLTRSCIDASYHADQWRGVSPKVEVALCDFTPSGTERLTLDVSLFNE